MSAWCISATTASPTSLKTGLYSERLCEQTYLLSILPTRLCWPLQKGSLLTCLPPHQYGQSWHAKQAGKRRSRGGTSHPTTPPPLSELQKDIVRVRRGLYWLRLVSCPYPRRRLSCNMVESSPFLPENWIRNGRRCMRV